jgi:hypothetical protein
MAGPQGFHFMVPSSALSITDDAIQRAFPNVKMTPESMDALRQEIADQVGMMYNRFSNLATVTPGPRQHAIMYGEHPPGWSSLFWQFASWPLAAQHQILAKTAYESLSKSKAMWTFGVLLTTAMTFGYMKMQLTNLLAGRPVDMPDWRHPAGMLNMMGRSLIAGGAAGWIGDKLLGTVLNGLQNETVFGGGPVIGDIDTAFTIAHKIWASQRDGKKYDPMPDIVRWAGSRIPFANLFYLKGMLNYLMIFHAFEWAQPGWWERTNRARLARGERPYAGYVMGKPVPYNPAVLLQNLGVGQ